MADPSSPPRSSFTCSLRLQIHHLRFHVLVQAVLAVRAADAALAAAGVEALHISALHLQRWSIAPPSK